MLGSVLECFIFVSRLKFLLHVLFSNVLNFQTFIIFANEHRPKSDCFIRSNIRTLTGTYSDKSVCQLNTRPEVLKLFSFSTQLSMLTNVKMSTIFGI